MNTKKDHTKPEEKDNKDNKSKSSPTGPESKASEQDNVNVQVSAEENTIAVLKQQLEKLQVDSSRNYDLALRAKAELENVRRRAQRDVTSAHKYALEKFIPELLPLLDSLDHGMQNLPPVNDSAVLASVYEGYELTIRMFNEVLNKHGIEVLDPTGDIFDPSLHEAISMQDTDEAESGTIMLVVQKGYSLNGRVLRPARVVVAK